MYVECKEKTIASSTPKKTLESSLAARSNLYKTETTLNTIFTPRCEAFVFFRGIMLHDVKLALTNGAYPPCTPQLRCVPLTRRGCRSGILMSVTINTTNFTDELTVSLWTTASETDSKSTTS